MTPILFVTCGIPGAGKSIVAAKLAKKQGINIHSSDAIRAEILGDVNDQTHATLVFRTLEKRVVEDLRNEKSTIYDACNVTRKGRRALLSHFNGIDCNKVLVFVDVPVETCLAQNHSRNRVIPDEVITNMNRKLTKPTVSEGWDIIFVVKPTSDGSELTVYLKKDGGKISAKRTFTKEETEA